MAGNRDLRTKAIVLRRTDYGEADRILNLITPQGKIAVIAKGVRKEKSKLSAKLAKAGNAVSEASKRTRKPRLAT